MYTTPTHRVLTTDDHGPVAFERTFYLVDTEAASNPHAEDGGVGDALLDEQVEGIVEEDGGLLGEGGTQGEGGGLGERIPPEDVASAYRVCGVWVSGVHGLILTKHTNCTFSP